MESRIHQTFHDDSCTLSHDPRLPCLKPYGLIHEIFDIARPAPPGHEHFGPRTVSVKNNCILSDLPSEFLENYATLEIMSSLVRQGIPISKHGPNARFEEKLRPLKNKNESNMLTISKVTDMFNDLNDTENVIYNNVTENILHSDENQLKLEEITFDKVKNSNVKYANLFFVDKNFNCICNTKIQCKCLNLTKTQISKIKRKDNSRISLFLDHADKSLNYDI